LLAGGEVGDVPLIVGANADEAVIFTLPTVLPFEWDYVNKMHEILGEELGDQVLALYPADHFDSPKAAYDAFVGDVAFVCPSQSTARAAAGGDSPAWLYHFTHRLSGFPFEGLGAFHALDLAFVFGNWDDLPVEYSANEVDLALTEDVQRIWTSFATSGVPAAEPHWPALGVDESIYVIAPEQRVTEDFREGRCEALRSLELVP
jgi:para-nitrobenzyl esterase